ncbi:hypothetical protein RMATCC62417_17244 [Rhizopus microsporus]|nr:hypothetical protein RMATCC62417_17244 [Rhizopus microsporus]
MSLFFGTQTHIGINGWLGAPIPQLHGLHQDDPLSPLLFNLAFEPLLRTILTNNQPQGVSLHPVPVGGNNKPRPCFAPLDLPSPEATSPISIKFLSYADDLETFLSHPSEWSYLLDLLSLYGRASNAKANLAKIVVMSLSGRRHPEWISNAKHHHLEWHDSTSNNAVRYLGVPALLFPAPAGRPLSCSKIENSSA